jgi:putative oxidoreductase
MDSMLARFGGIAHAALRIVSGFLFACHGAQKLLGAFGGMPPGFEAKMFNLVWFGGVIELVGGSLIALGVRTQVAAFICSGEMAVAYFMAHQRGGLLPIQNKGELAVMYCFVFLYLATNGGGPFALERGKK